MTSNSQIGLDQRNRIGLPWVYVRLFRGSFGDQLDNITWMDFDMHSRPHKDAGGHWIFSLKNKGEDVCMVRCWGGKALSRALEVVNALLDEGRDD